MASKAHVVQQLGESALLLPEAINDALMANDRLKFYLTLLQGAVAHALQPQQPVASLRVEREASGVSDAALDGVAAASGLLEPGLLALPGAQRIADAILADLTTMLGAIEAAPGRAQAAGAYRSRLTALAGTLHRWMDDALPLGDVEALTHVTEAHDTVHQLIIDMHRELNGLQAAIATASIDGATVYGLDAGDRPFVRAFMKGVNQTSHLKLHHEGLGTTATRVGPRLSIQNDIGTTEAHVLVLTVTGLLVTINYADVHRGRERFFRNLLQPWDVEWTCAPPSPGAEYRMSIGRYAAPDSPTLERYLTHVGSRLVFLIDWNKARKLLSRFISKDDAVSVLRWAADANVGHRAFLEAGEPALRAVLERITHPQLKFGLQLGEIIGAEAARGFFKSVLRISSEGLRAGRTSQLIADEVEAELLFRLGTPSRETLALAAEHAALLVAMADRVRRVLLRSAGVRAEVEAERAATLVKGWEAKADELVRRAKSAPPAGDDVLAGLLPQAGRAADALEQAAFLLTLTASGQGLDRAAALGPLGEVVCAGTREYVRCLEHARDLPNAPGREAVEAVLISVDRLLQIDRDTAAVGRAAETQLVSECADFRELHVLSRVAQALAVSVDVLRACSLVLRDLVFRDSAVQR